MFIHISLTLENENVYLSIDKSLKKNQFTWHRKPSSALQKLLENGFEYSGKLLEFIFVNRSVNFENKLFSGF